MKALRIVLVGLLALGCKASLPNNHFSCESDSGCPSGYTCVAGFCSESPGGVDADVPADAGDGGGLDSGAPRDGSADGGADGGAVDGGGLDAGLLDAGPGPLSGTDVDFPLGFMIIPLDTTHQADGLLRAFGLVYRLLKNDIPVSWVVRPGKALGEADFTVSARDRLSGDTISSHGYRGGPFVIHLDDVAAATSFVAAWQGVYPETTVHAATEDFTAHVAAQLVAAPNLALFADGNHDIAHPALQGASISDSVGSVAWDEASPDYLTPAEVAGPTTTSHHDGALFDGDGDPVYCFMASMHWDDDEAVLPEGVEVISEYRDFLQHPTHLFGQCQAAVSLENSVAGHFLTSGGFAVTGGSGDLPNEILITDLPFAQLDGPLEISAGSFKTLTPLAGYFDSDAVAISMGAAGRGTQDALISGFIDGDCSVASEPCLPPSAPGRVTYLGGHAYESELPLTLQPRTQGSRLFLNALLNSPCAIDVYQPDVLAEVSGPARTSDPIVTWTVRYENRGYGTALAAELVQRLPDGARFLSASDGGQLDGESVRWDLENLGHAERGRVTVTAALAGVGVHRSSARIAYRSGATPRVATSRSHAVYVADVLGSRDARGRAHR